jgi:hypothetical protein
MPIKFKPSELVVNRQTKKRSTKHYYMHTTSTEELQKTLANDNTRGPRKQKIRNELVRRGESLIPSEESA